MRVRSIIHLLSTALHGRSMPLPDFPKDQRRGIGLSDWDGYSGPLAERFNYQNTFLHTDPKLDITSPPQGLYATIDFIISSDVFEHVGDPVSRAFNGAHALLRPGGWMILTVPYVPGETIEHYPGMRAFVTVEIAGRYCVVWQNADGSLKLEERPVFHGGPGQTLEMRLFGESDLMRHLDCAGFDARVFHDALPEFGIFAQNACSLPILAQRRISSISSRRFEPVIETWARRLPARF